MGMGSASARKRIGENMTSRLVEWIGGLVMLRMIREYLENTGYSVGFKPAGGIRTARQSLEWLIMMKEELGREWMEPKLFRFGASGLLTDIERQLEHHTTGRYSAAHRQPAA